MYARGSVSPDSMTSHLEPVASGTASQPPAPSQLRLPPGPVPRNKPSVICLGQGIVFELRHMQTADNLRVKRHSTYEPPNACISRNIIYTHGHVPVISLKANNDPHHTACSTDSCTAYNAECR